MTERPPSRPPAVPNPLRPRPGDESAARQAADPRTGQRRPAPQPPQPPGLETYRPIDDRPPGAPPPFEQRYRPAPDRRRPAPARPRGGLLRTLAWTIGGLGVLVVGAAAALVVFAPVGLIRDQLVREVKLRTGRDLVIAGPTSLSVYPELAVSMSDVSLSAPAGMGGTPFIRMKRLQASVPLIPLLQRKVQVDQLILTEPVFDLRVDAGGRRTWDFAGLATVPHIQVAQAGKGPAPLPPELSDFVRNSSKGAAAPDAGQPAGAAAPRRAQALQDIAFGDVRIDNGTVRYRDERAGAAEEVKAIDARISGKSIATPVEAKGSFAVRGDRVEFDGRLASPKAMLEERASRVTLALSSPRATGRYDGSLTISPAPQLDGALKLDVGSLRGLATWLGVALPANGGLNTLALKSDLKTGPTWVALTNADVRLDDTTATGSVNVDVVSGRPSIKANLKVGVLNLDTYTPADTGTATAAPARAPASAPAAAPASKARPPGATGSGPQVKAAEHRSGWSEEPFQVAGLGLVDVDARLALAGILYRSIKVGTTQLLVTLKSGVARANIEDVKLYEGQGRGIVTLDAGSAKPPALGVNLTLDGVSGLPLMKDVAGFDWIAGKARVQVAIAGQGPHQRAIMESLSGKADIAFQDGALVGVNIPQAIRGLSQGKFGGFNRVATEKTDFSEAAASFQLKAGVAETKDLRAASPFMRVAGTGTVDIGQRQIDLLLRPKLVATTAGQGGATGLDLSGLEVPVRIRGAWEQPQIVPELDGILKDPEKAVDTIKQIGRQLKDQGAGALIRGILGK